MITYDMRDLADESLYEYLYRKIREDILAGRLKKRLGKADMAG